MPPSTIHDPHCGSKGCRGSSIGAQQQRPRAHHRRPPGGQAESRTGERPPPDSGGPHHAGGPARFVVNTQLTRAPLPAPY